MKNLKTFAVRIFILLSEKEKSEVYDALMGFALLCETVLVICWIINALQAME